MATVQTPQEMSLPTVPVKQESSLDLVALTMTALRLVSPWSVEPKTEKVEPKERIISLAEVSLHDAPNDCWIIIYDRVYDITNFFYEHPGGGDIMMEYAGQDASIAFRSSGHSRLATSALDRYLVGELPVHERLYRRPGGIRLSDMPE